MKRFIICSYLLSNLIFSTHLAFALSDTEIKQAIIDVIKLRHPTDTGEWWRSLGPTAPSVIISLYKDSTNIFHKVRFLDALAWYDDSNAVEFLKNVAASETKSVLQNSAIRAIAISQGMKEQEFLSRSLNHSDPTVRVETAKTLSTLKDPRAQKMVGKFLNQEKTTWVVQKVNAHRKHLATHQFIVHKKANQNL